MTAPGKNIAGDKKKRPDQEFRKSKAGWLDPKRVYDPYYYWKEYIRQKRQRLSR